MESPRRSKRLYLIYGKSGSGKTHLVEKLKWRPVKRYTTRPPRLGEERSSKEYIFIKEFEGEDHPEFYWPVAETTFDGYLYFTTEELLKSGDAYVLDPAGIEEIVTRYSKKYELIIVKVKAPPRKRLWRMVKRDWRKIGMEQAILKAIRRMLHDRKVFKPSFKPDITIRT